MRGIFSHLGHKVLVEVVDARVGARVDRRSNGDEENDVVPSKPFPLRFDVVFEAQVDGDVGSNPGRLLLADVGFGHLHDAEREERQRHPGPAAEDHLAVVGGPRFESRDGVLDVASDLVCRFQLEEFEIAQEVAAKKDEVN